MSSSCIGADLILSLLSHVTLTTNYHNDPHPWTFVIHASQRTGKFNERSDPLKHYSLSFIHIWRFWNFMASQYAGRYRKWSKNNSQNWKEEMGIHLPSFLLGELLEKNRILHILLTGAQIFFPQIGFKYLNSILLQLRDGNVVLLVRTDCIFSESHKSLLV